MIIVTGDIEARADGFERLRAACLAHVRRSREEPGCVSHDVFVDAENPLRLFFFERWESRAALEAHFAAPDSREIVRVLRAEAVRVDGPNIYEAAQ